MFFFSSVSIFPWNIIVVILYYSRRYTMSSYRSWLRVALVFTLLAVVYGAPIWEELFGLPPRRRTTQQTGRTPRVSGKEKFKATCWVNNPDNYAFPGQSPYPSAPLCPYWSRTTYYYITMIMYMQVDGFLLAEVTNVGIYYTCRYPVKYSYTII